MTRHSEECRDSTGGVRHHLPQPLAKEILSAVESIEYGTVEVTVHGGQVVQIERREKVRFDKGPSLEGTKKTTTPEPITAGEKKP